MLTKEESHLVDDLRLLVGQQLAVVPAMPNQLLSHKALAFKVPKVPKVLKVLKVLRVLRV